MKNLKSSIYFTIVALWVVGCSTEDDIILDIPKNQEELPDTEGEMTDTGEVPAFSLADKNADASVQLLYQRLVNISEQGIAFGHQDATAYGFNWTHSGFPSDSDVLRVTGDYPAVIGFDVGNLESGSSSNIDNVPFDLMKELIREAHREGSIVTLSWHADHPITGNLPWDTTLAVPSILPGGENETVFVKYINTLAEFLNDLKDDMGQPIPIIFRPWHEMNGSWFWWGNIGHSQEQYKQLFRETVSQLTANGVHNLLYCYSPDTARSSDEFFKFYPGDEWVDIFGADVYDFLDGSYPSKVADVLSILKNVANERNKLFALTETGLENVVENDWWTVSLYPNIKDSGIAYTLVWRNDRNVHHFGPYENHASADDFRAFVNSEDVFLRNDINTLDDVASN